MTDEHESIEKLLDSMSNDEPINWDSARREADPKDQSRIETLRAISSIASFNRRLQRRNRDGSGNAPADPIPDAWGNLLILEWIGAGARTQVYRAWDPTLQRDVALKLFAPDVALADGSSLLDLSRTVAGLRHPNSIAIHGLDSRDGRLGIWMDLEPATTLQQIVLARGPLAANEVARLGIEVGGALAAVHDSGMLHRNINPMSVMQTGQNRFLLADLDITHSTPRENVRATEQSDLCALGLVLWFAATGRPSVASDVAAETFSVSRLLENRPEVSAGLAGHIVRAIDLRPGAGFEGVRQFVGALTDWYGAANPAGHPEKRHRTRVGAYFFVSRIITKVGSSIRKL